MRKEIAENGDALSAEMLDGAIEIDRVPVSDRGGDEAEARGAEALVLASTQQSWRQPPN